MGKRGVRPRETLTPIEAEALRLLSKGYGARAQAEMSGRSENTMKHTLRRVYTILNVSGGAEAVMAGIRAGVIACPCEEKEG
jgi:DNA-binding CsgD family transcriptional regulator